MFNLWRKHSHGSLKRALSEDVFHTIIDTKKLIRNGKKMLKAQQAEFLDVSFATFAQRQVLKIQTVKDVITLIGVSVTVEKKYKIMELRSARVPVAWRELAKPNVSKWLLALGSKLITNTQ
jgi:hypothetical protein